MKMIIALSFLATTFSSFAQMRTEYVNLSRGEHVPLFNCDIYADYRDKGACNDIKRNERFRFENGGYAVNCYDSFRGQRLDRCLELARLLIRGSADINCNRIMGDALDERQCEETRRAYRRGEFEGYRAPVVTTTTRYSTDTRVVSDVSSRNVIVTNNSCSSDYFDRAYDSWRIRNEEQRRRGQGRAVLGTAAAIGGLILRQSDNGVVSTIGTGVALGGTAIAAMGLVDMASSNMSLPHMNPICQQTYVTETRRVVVERQECVTTRYSEQTRHSSRYYYEVNCQNKRYVTFEEFKPWQSGTVVTSYYRY